MASREIEGLIQLLARLPGLGPRSARRAVLHLMKKRESLMVPLAAALKRKPLHISGGPERIVRLAWCTGAAQGYIEEAIALGCDAYISGEISEQTVHIAREAGIHYFSAGHHATERDGVRALGEHLRVQFGLDHRFVDVDNPV